MRIATRRRIAAAVSMVALAGGAFSTATTPAAVADPWCPAGVEDHPGLGRGCTMPDGSFQLEAAKGTALFAHADPAPAESIEVNATPLDPVCVTDPNDFQILITYAHPPGDDRYATRADEIRNLAREANGRLDEEASEFATDASYRVACVGTTITVMNQPVTLSAVTFGNLTTALRALGGVYQNRKIKHWIWFEGASPTLEAGVGDFWDDDDLSIANLSNGNLLGYPQAASMAVQWGHCCSVDPLAGFLDSTTWMHEMGHVLGAVQGNPDLASIDDAPNSSGAGHCNDDQDVMCYDDGGDYSSGYDPDVCIDREHFDCGHDDYFNPAPLVGNYLATHWNLGSCLIRFIAISSCPAPVPHQADLWVGKATSGPWRGDGIINETGAQQTIGQKGRRNVYRTFYLKIENAGSTPQTFVLRETAKGTKVARYYIYPAGGQIHYTSMVAGAGYPFVIGPGGTKMVRVIMWFTQAITVGQVRALTIRAVSDDPGAGLGDVAKLQLTYGS